MCGYDQYCETFFNHPITLLGGVSSGEVAIVPEGTVTYCFLVKSDQLIRYLDSISSNNSVMMLVIPCDFS